MFVGVGVVGSIIRKKTTTAAAAAAAGGGGDGNLTKKVFLN